jgi:hypothetical protein
LPGLVLGLAFCDFANGKGVELAVVAEQDSITSVSFLQRRHDFGPPQHHLDIRQTTLPEFYHECFGGVGSSIAISP